MKKLFASIVVVIAIMSGSISVFAYSVDVMYLSCDGTNMTQGSSVSKAQLHDTYFETKINYNSAVGPVPVPSTGYLEYNIPYMPFRQPTTTGGVDPNVTYSYTYSPAYGSSCWYGSTSVSFWGDEYYKEGCKATTENFSTSYYKVQSGSGTGHDVDDNFSFDLKVN
jgi:hypothetical protein